MSAQPFPHSLPDTEADAMLAAWPDSVSMQDGRAPRRWWVTALRLVAVWLVLMLVCAHLALVLAEDTPRACDANASAQRVRGTPVSSAQTAVDGVSGIGKKVRDAYSSVLGPCVRRNGRA
ncbi:MAG: hypothetical protein V4636_21165 [Pseudomonadota bacterium]